MDSTKTKPPIMSFMRLNKSRERGKEGISERGKHLLEKWGNPLWKDGSNLSPSRNIYWGGRGSPYDSLGSQIA